MEVQEGLHVREWGVQGGPDLSFLGSVIPGGHSCSQHTSNPLPGYPPATPTLFPPSCQSNPHCLGGPKNCGDPRPLPTCPAGGELDLSKWDTMGCPLLPVPPPSAPSTSPQCSQFQPVLPVGLPGSPGCSQFQPLLPADSQFIPGGLSVAPCIIPVSPLVSPSAPSAIPTSLWE